MRKLLIICITLILVITIVLVAIPQTSIDKEIAIPTLTGSLGILAGNGMNKKK